MNGLDYVLMALVGLSALLGLWRGLLSELLALLAWVLALFAARSWAGEVEPYMVGWVSEPLLQAAAAFLLVFVAILAGMALVRLLLGELVRVAGLGSVDRFLGACFGALRGCVIVFAMALLVGLGGFAKEAWWQGATLSAPLETAVLASKPWLPELLVKRLRYR
ncbi:CvpA family protein [Zoogloea sp.]|uniref:CvpA family protein n=1 Tax=Zoogloea sp. TaxID=49181 RepID=UPI00261CBB9E|nr:CvpA family protein [Zoogloea sp.]MDD3353229.1 CvpA family protein [Zoogloea sp.]